MPNFDNSTDRTVQQRMNRAAPFRQSDEMDDLARLRDERPSEFAKMPPRAQIALGLYENARATHERIIGGTAT